MSGPPARAAPLDLTAFPFRTFDKIRYADTDRQGHVNNAVYATWVETGRVEFLQHPETGLARAGASFVIASLSLQYLQEALWPGRIDIGSGLIGIGKSSIRMHHGLFQDGRCVATADTVIVQTDEATRRSTPLSDAARDALDRYMLRNNA